MDGVHGSDVAKAAENSETNREKIDMAKNGPRSVPINEDHDDIKDINITASEVFAINFLLSHTILK